MQPNISAQQAPRRAPAGRAVPATTYIEDLVLTVKKHCQLSGPLPVAESRFRSTALPKNPRYGATTPQRRVVASLFLISRSVSDRSVGTGALADRASATNGGYRLGPAASPAARPPPSPVLQRINNLHCGPDLWTYSPEYTHTLTSNKLNKPTISALAFDVKHRNATAAQCTPYTQSEMLLMRQSGYEINLLF
ncbi:hypothetical protein ACJJTC_018303 [Scirpophaga incertulas]